MGLERGTLSSSNENKSFSSRSAASYSTRKIHKFTSDISLWVRHWVWRERFTHRARANTHTHSLTHVHDLMRDQRNQRERKQSNIWPLSQTLRCERRCYNFINILTEVHQCGHQAVIYTRICSDHLTTMALRLQVHHRRRWSDFRVYPLTLLQWCIGHGS